ncbi:2-amino-4-hydroxy-6-hydroxymethyldihydropteridine diphosphokinase [Guyparkeria sp. 1SP6A2]|nr:2-amino-4-hydroxy-6-hydroxymethyldihydropteridine diphosphokinase [Guyparkeria sp. 1SP6A2]
MIREIATIGLGANLGNPIDQIERAVEAIDSLPLCRVRAVSGLYANPPIGPQDQPDYVNAVAEIETALSPEALLRALKGLERAAGRSFTRHWGERLIDLDILAFGDRQMQTAELQIPHPEIAHRHFVLAPWLEIRPEAALPDGRRLAALLADTSGHPLRFIRAVVRREADNPETSRDTGGHRPRDESVAPSDQTSAAPRRPS